MHWSCCGSISVVDWRGAVEMQIQDNYDMWLEYDRKQQKKYKMLPICDNCQQHIIDDYFYLINGEKICSECLENEFRKDVEDFMQV